MGLTDLWDAHRFSLFLGAALLLLMGHVVRATRMTSLYPANSRVRGFDLLLGLTLGYCVNTLVPARLGELVRVLYVGKRCRMRYAYVAATVICERLSDALVLGLLAVCLLSVDVLPASMLDLTLSFLIACASGIAIAVLVHRSALMRRTVWQGASLFNTGVCHGILDLAWSYAELVTSRQMLRWRFLSLTVVMWLLYGLSFLVFGLAAHTELGTVATEMLGTPLHSLWDEAIHGRLAGEQVLFIAFAILPVFAILLIGLFREQNSFLRVCSALFRGHFLNWDAGAALVGEHFKDRAEYDVFLRSTFAKDDPRISGFGLNAIEDAVVHRLFQGGSGAVTALVEADSKMIIRKYAVGDLMGKLEQQVQWLDAYQLDLSLVEIVGERVDQGFYRYDMPYSPDAVDFYDVIHTAPIEKSARILSDVVSSVHEFHLRHQRGKASEGEVAQYLQEKVVKNVATVLRFVGDVLPGEKYTLNGKEFDLRQWQSLQDVDWLMGQVDDRSRAVIHGDLTIENVIVDPNRPCGWFLIDPNTGNVFDTPFIDWAKLSQSLHLGYEGLNRAGACTLNGCDLSLAMMRSHAYEQLNELYGRALGATVGSGCQREIRFHELVNYVRLVPYKIRQSPGKGLTFFACTSMLLAAYVEDYG